MKARSVLFASLFVGSCLQASYRNGLCNSMRRMQGNVISRMYTRKYHDKHSPLHYVSKNILKDMQYIVTETEKKDLNPLVLWKIASEQAEHATLSNHEIAQASVYVLISEQRRLKEIDLIDKNAVSNAGDALVCSRISLEELGAIFNDIKPQVDKFDRPWRSNWSALTEWLKDGSCKEFMEKMEDFEQGHRQCSDMITKKLLNEGAMTLKEIASLTNTHERRVNQLFDESVRDRKHY